MDRWKAITKFIYRMKSYITQSITIILNGKLETVKHPKKSTPNGHTLTS